MTSQQQPLEFLIHLEISKLLDASPLEITYQVDKNFSLTNVFDKLFPKVRDFPDQIKGEVSLEIISIEANCELQIFKNDKNKDIFIENIENGPFIADSKMLKVSWESDRYIMMNQEAKVIELHQGQKYLMIIRKRSKKKFIFTNF